MNALLSGHVASLEQRYTGHVIPGPESFQMIENKTPLILCVDDEVVGLRVRKILLERAGYRVLTKVPILLLSAYVGLPEEVSSLVDIYMTKGEGAPALLQKLGTLLSI
jgi:hypothetical protein